MSTTNLQDALDRDYAAAWTPKDGESLIGTVVDVSERDGDYGRYPIVTIRTEGGDELAVHAFHDVLASELARVAPSPGLEIGVKYLGRHPERGYHRYKVRRAGQSTAEVTWDRYSGEPDRVEDVDGLEADAASVRASESELDAIDEAASDDIPA